MTFDDVVAYRQARRIINLAARLRAEPSIEEAVHEDREVILVRSGLSTAELEGTVATHWKRRGDL